MKYTLITAALAAVSLATTVNIDVEGSDISADNNRHGHHSRMSRHHHHHRHHHHGGHRSWWTELFGHKNHDDRNHHNGRDRRLDLDELLEELFKVNFECIRQAEWSTQQFKECYRKHAEGVNEDLIRRDDEIFGDYDAGEELDEESRNRRHRHRHHHHRHRHHRHGRNYVGNNQVTLESNKGRHHKHHHRSNDYECRIQTEDPLRQDEILRQCCEEQQLGRYNPEQHTCEDIEGREDRDEFQQCAYEQGVLDAECWRERRGGRDEDEE